MNRLLKLLTLPGDGVYTVHTGKEKKEKILMHYYQTKNVEEAKIKWKKTFTQLSTQQPWILGVPSDTGGGIQRGANWGPLSIREELCENKNNFTDLGDVRVIPHLLHDKYLNEKTIRNCQKVLYGRVNKLPVSPLSQTEMITEILYKKYSEAKILGLGGDHSVSYPLVKSWLRSRRDKKKAGLLHFDAHTDLLSERLGIDLCFGTWTYHILKELYSPKNILQVGIRSSGKNKLYWKKNLGVEQIWANEVKKNGVKKIYERIASYYKKLKIEEIYISFDIDALDKNYAVATGTPEEEGLSPSDCAALIRLIKNDFKITGADLTEVAPFVLPEESEARDRRSSLMVAGDLAQILLDVLR